jgi:hypothetical protein
VTICLSCATSAESLEWLKQSLDTGFNTNENNVSSPPGSGQ